MNPDHGEQVAGKAPFAWLWRGRSMCSGEGTWMGESPQPAARSGRLLPAALPVQELLVTSGEKPQKAQPLAGFSNA